MKEKIDKKLLPMKAHYFLFNAGTAPVVPFMPTLARQLGFSSVVTGTMYTILPIIGMLAKPTFGLIADKFQKHKILFLLAQFLTAISFFCIMFIPSVPPATKIELNCNDGISEIKYCPTNQNIINDLTQIDQRLENEYANQTLICELECIGNMELWSIICENWNITTGKESCPPKNINKFQLQTFINTYHIVVFDKCLYLHFRNGQMNGINTTLYCPSNKTNDIFKSNCSMICKHENLTNIMNDGIPDIKDAIVLYQFWMFFGLLALSWSGMAVVVSVGDSICFSLLGEQHHLYGNQRLWGAIGWGICSIITGLLVDKMSNGNITKDYSIAFYMTFFIILLDICASYRLQETKTQLSHNIFKDIGKIFLSLRVIIFFVWCITVGLCTALIWNFLFWHLEDLGGNNPHMKTIEGLAMGIQCFGGELPFFFLSGWILKNIGHVNAMSIVLFGFSIRFLCYSMLTNPWWVLPIELLNGVTFGIFYSTMASYASIIAPPGTEATLQGLTGAIFEGIGVSVGSFIGGILINVYKGSETFRIFSIAAFLACLIHVLLQWLLKKIYGKQEGYTMNYHHSPTLLLDDQDQ